MEPVLGDVVPVLMCNSLERGPDGGKGMLVVHAPPLSNGSCSRYVPDSQQWWDIKPHGYWLGIVKDSPPTEPDLKREEIYEDYRIKLADGHDWAIMAIRPFGGRLGEMPRVGYLGDDFTWRWRPDARFDKLIQRFSEVWDKRPDLHNEWAELAVEALQVNYRVDKYLIMCCELLGAANCYRVVALAMDEPVVTEWLESKKKEEQLSADSSTNAGGETPSASLDSPQPSQT